MKKISFQGYSFNDIEDKFYNLVKPQKNIDTQNDGYYFLSNDVIQFSSENISPSPHAFIAIANPHSFHALYLSSKHTEFKRMIFVDYNYQQVKHFIRLRKLILSSKNRFEYLEKLFFIKLNNNVRNKLTDFKYPPNYVPGGSNEFDYQNFESEIWNSVQFDNKAFYDSYNLQPKKTSNGVLIRSNTIGDINKYYATILSGSKLNFWTFTAGFGSGFLKDDNAFNEIKELLSTTPTYIIVSDITQVYEEIIYSNKYLPIVFWSSNVFDKYFQNKNKNIKIMLKHIEKLGSNEEPNFPEIDINIIQDNRKPVSINDKVNNKNRKRRDLSIHTNSFRAVSKYLTGENNLEVFNVNDWSVKDNGNSKLPNTEYILEDKFLNKKLAKNYDTIFLHILYGHGCNFNKFNKILTKAKKSCKTLLVLEHNANSTDFKGTSIGIKPSVIRKAIGKENKIELLPGKNSKDRNFLMVYGPLIKNRYIFLTPEYITEQNWDGGLANYLYKITTGLKDRGIEVHVVVSSDRNEDILYEGVNIHQVKFPIRLYNLLNILTLKLLTTSTKTLLTAYVFRNRFFELHKKYNFDIVQNTNYLNPGLLINNISIPTILRLSSVHKHWSQSYQSRNIVDDWIVSFLERRTINNSHKTYAPSTIIKNIIKKQMDVDVDIIETPFTSSKTQLDDGVYRKRLSKKQYILFYGTIGRLKGIEFIGNTLEQFLNANRNLHLVVVGKKVPINKTDPIELLKNNAKAHQKRIIYLPSLKKQELLPIIKNAEIVLLPSIIDNLPNTLIESMADGKIVIGTYDGGFDQLIKNGENGYLVRYGDNDALLNTINRILSLPKRRKELIEKEARKTIKTRLDNKKIIDETIRYYEKTVEQYYQ